MNSSTNGEKRRTTNFLNVLKTKKFDDEVFLGDFETFFSSIFQTILIDQWKNELRKTFSSTSILGQGEVLCRSCGYFLGFLSNLRVYENYYFIDDRQFYNRIEEKLDDEPEEFVKSRILGKTMTNFLVEFDDIFSFRRCVMRK